MMSNQGHSLRDTKTGIIRRDIRLIHVRMLDSTVPQDEITKVQQKIEAALKATANDMEYVVVVTPPGVVVDVDWMQPFLKKLEDTSSLLKDGEFSEQLRKLLEYARQKRWGAQGTPPGALY
jgi:hypothetical protein